MSGLPRRNGGGAAPARFPPICGASLARPGAVGQRPARFAARSCRRRQSLGECRPAGRPGGRQPSLRLREAAAGRDQGKGPPACLVAASDSSTRPRFVVILPITHLPPAGDTGIEIPPKVRRALGRDEEPCWVIVSEHNVDEWPNAGLEPIPGRPGVFAYGFVPPRLFAEIRRQFLELARQHRSPGVRR